MAAKLDREERELLKKFERGEWRPVKGLGREMRRYRNAAATTVRKEWLNHILLKPPSR